MKNLIKYASIWSIVMMASVVVGQNQSKVENPNWANNDDWTIMAPYFNMRTSAKLIHNSRVMFADIIIGDGDTLIVGEGATFSMGGSIDIRTEGVLIVYGVLEGNGSNAELDVDGTFIVKTNGVVNWAGSWDNVNPDGTVVVDGWITIGNDLDNNGIITGVGCIQVSGGLDNSGSIFECSLPGDNCGPSIGNCPYPLPVELTEFNLEEVASGVKISWTTASERNNDYFTIQKSIDGLMWEEVMTVEGTGTSTELNSYEEYDNNYYVGLSYYRLMQTDFDGKEMYSETKAITMEKMVCSMFVVYPNPSSHQFTIEGDCLSEYSITLYDSNQKRVQANFQRNGATAILDVQNLSKGIYFLRVTDGIDTEVIQLMIK